jgi:hypothetical protein
MKVIAIEGDLAREFERKPKGRNIFLEVRDLSKLAIRSLTVISQEKRLAANVALRHLSRREWKNTSIYVAKPGCNPLLVADGMLVTADEQVELKKYLQVIKGQFAPLSEEERGVKIALGELEAAYSTLNQVLLEDRTIPINQELDRLVGEIEKAHAQLKQIGDQHASLVNRERITDLSISNGRWAVARGGTPALQLTFRVDGTTEGPLPPKTRPHCESLRDLLVELLKHQTNLERAFYLAPVIAVDNVGKPLGMPTDVLNEYRGQKGEGKSGKAADRAEELDAWHHLVYSWNWAFPNDKVKEIEGGGRRNSGPPRPKSPLPGAASSGTRTPPSWVERNLSLEARVRDLELQLFRAQNKIADQSLEFDQLSRREISCPSCPHCNPAKGASQVLWLDGMTAGEKENLKTKGKASSRDEMTVPRPSPPAPKGEGRPMAGQTNGLQGPALPSLSKKAGPGPGMSQAQGQPVARKGKVSLLPEDAKAIRQALGLPHRDDVSGLTTEERNSYYGSSRIPLWATRGFALSGQAFLDDVREGRVSKDTFNDWYASKTRPSRSDRRPEDPGVTRT